MMRKTLLASLIVASVGFSLPAGAAEKLRAGMIKMAAMTNLWVAKQEGIFAKNGLDVEFVEFRNGNEAIAAHRGGAVDIILAIPGTAMAASERGFDLMLLMQNETAKTQGPDAGAIQVLADSPFQKLSDLNGKRIAVSGLHSQMTVSVQMALQKGGVDVSKVQFVEIPFPSMGDVLRSKQVDAIAVLDPWVTQLATTGVSRNLGWAYVDALPEQPLGAWWARAAYVQKNPDVTKRFVASLQEAIDYLNADEPRARREVAAFTGLDPALTEKMPLITWETRIKAERWQATIDMMRNSGELTQAHKADEYFSDVTKADVVN